VGDIYALSPREALPAKSARERLLSTTMPQAQTGFGAEMRWRRISYRHSGRARRRGRAGGAAGDDVRTVIAAITGSPTGGATP